MYHGVGKSPQVLLRSLLDSDPREQTRQVPPLVVIAVLGLPQLIPQSLHFQPLQLVLPEGGVGQGAGHRIDTHTHTHTQTYTHTHPVS